MKLTPEILDKMIEACIQEDVGSTPTLNENIHPQAKTSTKLTPQILKRMLKEQLKKKTYEWILLPPGG